MSAKKQPIPFGKYFLLDRINIGGMAEVWRAKTFGESGFEKLVAIKRILPNIAEDDEFITMFIDEAKITVQLTHANIAQVFDLGKIGDSYFIAMEYVAGRDMRAIFDRCRKKGEPAPIPMVCFMVGKMCEGLDYAHRKKDSSSRDLNIVHRDVSPQNCLISFEGEVKVIDFGIAKAANKATKTQAGILKGKFGYMSPEQVRGLPLDQRSDVFACGVVLYEMLTGERLFVGDSDFSVLEKVRQVDILPPTKYNRRIPEALEKIVIKSLAKDPEERYQFASDLSDALQRFLITSESVFSRKDLMQYMKSTFAEDVEREKMRQAEYAEIKLPAGLAALAGAPPAPAGTSRPPPAPPRATQPPMPAVQATAITAPPVAPPAAVAPPAIAARPPPSPPPRPEKTNVIDGADLFADVGTLPGDAPLPVVPSAAAPANGRPPPAIAPARPPPAIAQGRPPGAVAPPQMAANGRPPQRTHTLEPAAPSEYKPRMQEAAVVTSGGDKKKLVMGGAAGLVVCAVLGAVYVLGSTGTLFIDYEPRNAKVALDGKPMCSSSPCFDTKVPAGPHQVSITLDGYDTFKKDIEVPRGDTFRLQDISLKAKQTKVALFLVAQPAEAEVKLNGEVVKDQGSKDFYSGEIIAGKDYEVEVSYPGYEPFKKTLNAAPTEKQVKELATLKAIPFKVSFASNPSGATVLIDNSPAGTTPFAIETLDPGKTHTVVFQKKCFDEATHTLMAPGKSQDVSKDLVKTPNCK